MEETKKAPEGEREDMSQLIRRIEALERTTKYQYWFVLAAFVIGTLVGHLLY